MRFTLLFLTISFLSLPAIAQNNDFERRLELAKEMHEYRPVKNQVDRAIDIISQRVPQQERDKFRTTMKNILNYDAIEVISVEAMAETFTLAELEAMTDYYGKPEAASATEKLDDYSKLVQPEIAKMIDKAMIKLRTGQ